nr:CBS domain-containing protein CBSCBSPB3 [Ipomoea batatas]GMC63211.1 CBS domain-containing protein CBSCBSPB3 [Ipomoea batatas]
MLTTDTDLIGAVSHARLVGLKVLRLHLDLPDSQKKRTQPPTTTTVEKAKGVSLLPGIFAGAVVLTSIGVLTYLKRSKT